MESERDVDRGPVGNRCEPARAWGSTPPLSAVMGGAAKWLATGFERRGG